MEKTEKWNETESIQLIRSMIEDTKYRVYQDRFLYFMWGYVTLGCAVGHYILAYFLSFQYPYVVWLAMPVMGITHFIYIGRKVRSSKISTFTGRVMAGIWGGMFMGIVVLMLAATHIGWNMVYPIFMLFYGVASYATGKAIQFRFLIWGGIASLICGFVAFYQPFQYQLTLLMLAVLLSYILPAHLMQGK